MGAAGVPWSVVELILCRRADLASVGCTVGAMPTPLAQGTTDLEALAPHLLAGALVA